ncbi:winged helix-turn-helix domain-containing protein [Pseudoalteromonas tunicata]|uniref:winged helix-turn-helix domain-containing protein n=1 Tax=Pseudoalteromonas tunicata TaxID=314281 RepID=UPI00273FEE75|nr:winged helix-turn-helix domain-containing protein [Pseudoalteromonas tunicata]MDP5212304.1 winged helix-turn-helix domain-containing protein [Pseudoalteromonas tunicata]
MIQIGRYQLDEEEMVLSCDDQRVLLEPKVFEVLTYFCQHHNRYISMTELHENIWQGRCVSDAAVRRIISKIRILMNDDHKNPTYIQSLPKRGYKLICPVEYDIEDDVETSAVESTAVVTPNVSEHNEANNYNGPAESEEHQDLAEEVAGKSVQVIKKPKKFKYTFLSLLILCICILSYLVKPWFFPAIVHTQVVNTLPGDKIAVTQSADGSYLAFSGQVQDDSGFQIYIKHQSDFDFRPITQQTHLPGALAFSPDNQFLYFSDSTPSASFLYRISIKDGGSAAEVIVKNYYLISDVFSARTTGDVFFAAKETANSPFLIYQYDIKNKKIINITSSSQAESLDIKGDISFDGTKLAVLRTNRLGYSDELRIINLTNNEVVKRKQIPGGVFDIAWEDDTNILVLRRKQLIRVNMSSNGATQNFKLGEELLNLDSNSQKIVSINLGLKQKLFIEKTLPFSELETRRILTKDIYQMRYFGDKTLALLKGGEVTQLGFIDLDTNHFDSILATEYELRVLDVAISNSLILVKINRRFALFDPANIGLEYITTGDDIVSDAAFSIDGRKVLFTTKNYEQWRASTFDVETKVVEPLILAARYVRPFGDNYIIGNAEGNMFFYDAETKNKVALNQNLSKEPNAQWFVRGNYVYWSSHDLVNTTFFQLNIDNINKPMMSKQEFKYAQVGPDFSIDTKNEKFLMSQIKHMTSEVLEVLIK